MKTRIRLALSGTFTSAASWVQSNVPASGLPEEADVVGVGNPCGQAGTPESQALLAHVRRLLAVELQVSQPAVRKFGLVGVGR